MKWSAWEKVTGFDFEDVVYEKKYRDRGGGVARLSFNRPQRMNAMTALSTGETVMAVQDASQDKDIGVIVISAIGDHFGVGGDVGRLAGRPPPTGEQRTVRVSGGPGLDTSVRNCLKPVIAAVRGYCIGAHNHLAYFCDFTIAADSAIFGQNGPRVGSPAHGHIVASLALVVGQKRAKEIWMLCRRYTAQEALAMGLVNAVVPLAKLDEEVDRWCDELLDISPTCLAIVKQSFEAVDSYLMAESGRVLSLIAPDFRERPDVREAPRAFFEKRAPNFWGSARKA